MTFCVNCGKKNPAAKAKFCPHCGTPSAILETESPKAKPTPLDDKALDKIVNGGLKLFAAGNLVEGIEFTMPAVEAGDPQALNNVGFAYFELGETKKAVELLTKAAESGIESAMQTLLTIYWPDDEPIKKNEREIGKWLTLLAERGHAWAMCDLYVVNKFFGKDKIAREWLHKAAAQGYEPAKEIIIELGIIEEFAEDEDGNWSWTFTATEPGGFGQMPKPK